MYRTLFVVVTLVAANCPRVQAQARPTIPGDGRVRQEELRKEWSLLGQFLGPEVLGGYLSLHLGDHVSVNAGLGLNTDAHLGSTIYLMNRNGSRHSVYVGAQLVSYHEFMLSGVGERQPGIYIPVGYEYVARGGFTVQIEMGPNLVRDDWGQTNTRPFLAALRVGKTRLAVGG